MCDGANWKESDWRDATDLWCCFDHQCNEGCQVHPHSCNRKCATTLTTYFGILEPKKMCIEPKYCGLEKEYDGGQIHVEFVCEND